MNRTSKSTFWGILSICALAVGGCTSVAGPDGTDGSMTDPDGTEAPTPTGAELFKLITQDDPFGEWGQFPDHAGVMDSNLPHGPMSEVFINSVVESALDDFNGALPDGSIIVKENLGTSDDVTEAVLTVMWKVTGFDPDNNDWFWANMALDGEIMAEGKVAGCMGCHGGARANDFVFVHQF